MLLQLLQETDTIGVVGARETSTGVPLTHGVEARITNLQETDGGWLVHLLGERLFERQGADASGKLALEDEVVRWLDLGLSDVLSAARSPSRSVELAARELGPLVATWLELARGGGSTLWGKPRERAQSMWGGVDPDVDKAALAAAVDRMLSDLGELPGPDRPSERALWVAALINPSGADRQAWPVLDIRSAILRAKTPVERLSVAKTGLIDSIYKLKGGKWPINTYYW